MHAVACQGIEEHGERGHEGLTLTGGHLGNLALMQHDAAKELHVVVHHLPLQVVATSCPVVMVDGLVAINGDKVFSGVGGQVTVEVSGGDDGLLVLGEAAGRILDNGIDLGHHLVEGLLINLQGLLLQLVHLGKDVGTLVERRFLNGGLQLFYLGLLLLGSSLHVGAYLLSAGTQCIVVQLLHLGCLGLHLLHEGLYEFHVTRRLVAKE